MLRMSPRACKLVASLLITLQVFCGVAGGKVWCIPLWQCECPDSAVQVDAVEHVHDEHACPGHHEESPTSPQQIDDCAGCGCHIHLPVPAGKETSPSVDQRAALNDASAPAALLVAVIDWKPVVAPVRNELTRPPKVQWGGTEAGLRTTRLLI